MGEMINVTNIKVTKEAVAFSNNKIMKMKQMNTEL